MFDRWIIIRSGFTQHAGDATNGCTDVFASLAARHGGNGNRIELQEWKACPKHTSHMIVRLSGDKAPAVTLCGYSWGAGYGTMAIARELHKHGIGVPYMVLSDPVYHGVALWRALIPSSLMRWIKIKIPPNVRHVYWCRQRENKPCGHDLVAESPYTKIHDPLWVDKPHAEMDNCLEFRLLCRGVAERMMHGDLGDEL